MKMVPLPENGDKVFIVGIGEDTIIVDDEHPAVFVGGDIFNVWQVKTQQLVDEIQIMWGSTKWNMI